VALAVLDLEVLEGGSGAMARLSLPLLMLTLRGPDDSDESESTESIDEAEEAQDETGLTVTVTVAEEPGFVSACL
jgi:hypothetical protein